MAIRPATDDDHDAIVRVYREVGWLEDGEAAHLDPWLADATKLVGTVDDAPEAIGTRHAGHIMVDTTDLPFAAVTSIAVAPVGRRRGLASSLTARTVVEAAEEGFALALLGIFDQGFYDRFGFGTGATTLLHHFDPAALTVDPPTRQPVRLTVDDWEEIQAATRRRWRSHGGVVFDEPGFVRGELGWAKPFIALGLRDDAGELTDLLWGEPKGEHGPWKVYALTYREPSGLLDLLGLLRLMGDQVHSVQVAEPAELSLEDVLDQPFRHRRATSKAEHAAHVEAFAHWQARILDLPAVVAARPWAGTPVRFVVEVDDPLAHRDDVDFDDVHGTWTVELASSSTATRGATDDLPVVRAGVGAFTRLLLGVAPASGLALVDQLDGPTELLARLDRALATARPPNPGTWF
ncbi:GNAT family N-acetyltransferase [Salsipaludibacter albus]|uniref:GNAT family N-acetyltransferase n=1 Tax=Salsipaludibacter albus TaxID=2849650 RepID=UPI001EE3C29E|nr:GNAT family N-acetyltransferase [Salsipaludibacter albus]MBY5162145.1 GNAT family N-acetyltransferase [Salsipaludibacter albus]